MLQGRASVEQIVAAVVENVEIGRGGIKSKSQQTALFGDGADLLWSFGSGLWAVELGLPPVERF